jgi:dihydropteroate synthase
VSTSLIGILNFTANSFCDGGKYNTIDQAIQRINELFNHGAGIVDIGAQSTTYNSPQHTEIEEWDLLRPLLINIKNKENISIDTYNYLTAKNAVEMGFKIINDVSGGKNSKLLDLIASNSQVKYICMFSLELPANKENRINNINEIFDWTANCIARCNSHGIKNSQLIIDPGIGFSTSPKQSFEIIKKIHLFKQFEVPICIGHSRKSFFESMIKYPSDQRDFETLACSIYLFDKVDYLRVHNVEAHTRAFKVWQKLCT